jgi:uncharacterized membrane protein YbaN (DUF454 family)
MRRDAQCETMNEPGASSTALQDPQTPAYCPIRSPVLRWLLLLAAVACLAMGIVGIFVPGLPTTVFILMAGACAARSSPRLHAWLWQHRLFGGMLRNWAAGGFVSRKAKWSASITMAVCAVIMLLVPAPVWAKALSISCMACVLVWLWCRPEPQAPH